LVGLLCEVTKIVVEGVRTGNWGEGLFRSGGMPSTHSAFVTSLLIVVWYTLGAESVEFAIALTFACIVWYDAMNSRRAIGLQAHILNSLQKKEHLAERIGHSFKEVAGGILFGGMVTWIGIWMSA
ncbi:divergent PAP2 family protein, partial [Candidatus Peribacteria bacterium]|nr:divergent PAP2 family protein [Candidatus Peribacteria bacterium]